MPTRLAYLYRRKEQDCVEEEAYEYAVLAECFHKASSQEEILRNLLVEPAVFSIPAISQQRLFLEINPIEVHGLESVKRTEVFIAIF